ncbi:uncharacterized protein J3R85_009684 [Psidium guajava]|nr:uncharacterized protein J3R85_009684 [Psidium guajava]
MCSREYRCSEGDRDAKVSSEADRDEKNYGATRLN